MTRLAGPLGLLLLLCLSITASQSATAAVAGRWEGAFSREGAVQWVQIDMQPSSGTFVGEYSIPELGLFDEPLREMDIGDSSWVFRCLYGRFEMRFHEQADEWTGINAKWGPPLKLHLKRAQSAPARFRREDVRFRNDSVTLAGSVFLPEGTGPFPAVVAVHGNGAQGRQMWEYRAFGYALARLGVACLVYDKRGVGESGGDWQNADFRELAEDAQAGLRKLRAMPQIEGGRVGLLGISQGGWIATIAATRSQAADFLVLIQGPSVSLDNQERDAVEYTLRQDGHSASVIDSALAYTDRFFALVQSGGTWDDLAEEVLQVQATTWTDYVPLPDSSDSDDLAWWRRCAYDPAQDLMRMPCPLLAFFGETDPYVPPATNADRMVLFLDSSGVEHKVRVIPGLGHSMTYDRYLLGDRWGWPEAFWVWSKRAHGIDIEVAAWIHDRSPH